MFREIIRNNWFRLLVLLGLSFLLFFFKINMPLTDGDSAYYGTIAYNIVRTGDWQTLHSKMGDPNNFVDKAPMSIWPIAVSYYVFGKNDWSTKIPNALLAIGCILLTFLLARDSGARKTSFWAGLVLLTSIMFFYCGLVPQQDIPMLFFITLSLWSFFRFLKTKQAGYFYLVWAGLGCNTLTRGLPGIFTIVGIIGFYLILHWVFKLPKLNLFKSRKAAIAHCLVGLSLFLVIGILWYVLEYVERGPRFLERFLGYGLSRYFTKAMNEETSSPSFLVEFPMLLGCVFPWTGYLWHALKLGWAKRKENGGFYLLVLAWLIVAFMLTIIIKWRAIRYLLPCVPPLAILIGEIVSNLTSDPAEIIHQKASRFASVCNFIIAIPLALGVIYSLVGKTGTPEAYLSIIIPFLSVLVVGLLGFSLLTLMKKYRWAIYFQVIFTICSYLVLLTMVHSNINYVNPWPQVISKLTEIRKPGEKLYYLEKATNLWISFYLGEHAIVADGLDGLNQKIVKGELNDVHRFFVITPKKTAPDTIEKRLVHSARVQQLESIPLGPSLFLVIFN